MVWILIIVASVLVESGTNDNLTLEHKRKVLMLSPDVMGIKRLLEDRGYVIIPGQIMKDVLRQYGAVDQDFQLLESGAIHRYLPLDQQPAMRHRLVNIVTQLLQSPELHFRTRVTGCCSTPRTRPSSLQTPTPSLSTPAARSLPRRSKEQALLSKGDQ